MALCYSVSGREVYCEKFSLIMVVTGGDFYLLVSTLNDLYHSVLIYYIVFVHLVVVVNVRSFHFLKEENVCVYL